MVTTSFTPSWWPIIPWCISLEMQSLFLIIKNALTLNPFSKNYPISHPPIYIFYSVGDHSCICFRIFPSISFSLPLSFSFPFLFPFSFYFSSVVISFVCDTNLCLTPGTYHEVPEFRKSQPIRPCLFSSVFVAATERDTSNNRDFISHKLTISLTQSLIFLYHHAVFWCALAFLTKSVGPSVGRLLSSKSFKRDMDYVQ